MSERQTKLPFLQWNSAQWLADPKLAILRRRGNLEALGLYFEIINCIWVQGNQYSMPFDEAAMADMLGLQKRRFTRIWQEIKHLFKHQDGQIISKRLREEVERQANKSQACSTAAKARWDKGRDLSDY